MTSLHFKNDNGLRAFASLNMPNTFKFIIDSHNYYMPQILADYLSPAVAQMHMSDPTLNFFLISEVSDQNLDFELFMHLVSGRAIELTPENAPFIEIVASKLMNEDIVKIASDYLNKLSPITIDNAIFRLNQKRSVGILPINEIQFIAENLWVINPQFLFQINYKDLNLILSNQKLKIINEDWLFHLILKFVKDKGERYRISFSYIIFQDLSMSAMQIFFEKSEIDQIDEFIYRSVKEKLTSNIKNTDHQSHLTANQSEINYVYQKSKDQKDSNGYSFNSEFFDHYHLYDDQQTFEYISSLFDNSSSSSFSSPIYNFNAKFNPFDPNPKKTFPEYFSKINSKNNEEEENKEKKRKPLIQDELYPFYNMPINIHHSGDLEQIPVNFTNTPNYTFSSSDDDESDKSSNEGLLNRIANQVFNTSQKIFNDHDQKAAENEKDEKKNQNGFFSTLKNGFLNFFTPANQEEPENIVPREEELTSFKPEPIIPNQRQNNNNGWPFPLSNSHQEANTSNHSIVLNEENNNNDIIADNGANGNIHVSVHDSNEDDDRIRITNNESINQNQETGNTKNKSDDDSDLDGYGGFAKEQY